MIVINILFLSIGRMSDMSNKGIYTDLIREFHEKGHNMYVVSPIERREKVGTSLEKDMGINVLRVKTGNLTKNNLIEKGINTVLIEHLFLKAIKKNFTNVKFDLVLYSTPPITFANVIEYIKRRDSATTYLLLKDIFPQNAVDLNMFKEKSLIHNYFKKKEKKLYYISDYIGCMSEANVKYIIENNKEIAKEKVEVNPNSISPIFHRSYDKNKIYEKYNIPQDKINFIYGGNLGKPQGIDFLLDCVKAVKNNGNIHFTVVGSGTQDKLISDYYFKEKPENFTFINFLPKNDYEELLSTADVGMVFLDKRFTIPNFPSRILSYMQASLPILTVTDSITDIGDIIEENSFGFKFLSNDVNEFDYILSKFYNEKDRELMGENAKEYLLKNYTVKNSYEIIMNHFE